MLHHVILLKVLFLTVSIPFSVHFKLSKKYCPTSNEEKKKMESIPYSSTLGNLAYAMVSTRPNTTHAVGVVSRFLSNPVKILA